MSHAFRICLSLNVIVVLGLILSSLQPVTLSSFDLRLPSAANQGHAEVLMDHAEFGLFLKKNPELERAGAQALRLDEFFRALLNN